MVREASGGLCICQKLFCMVKAGYRIFRNIHCFDTFIVYYYKHRQGNKRKKKTRYKNIQIFLKKVDFIVNMLYNEKVMENMVYNYYKDNTR